MTRKARPGQAAGGSVQTRAEILKLSRLLGVEVAELEYLEAIPPADLQHLRDQVTEVLFSSGAGALSRLAAASNLLPVALVASLAQRAFGPILSARIAGLIEPGRAAQMAAKLPTGFLADIAVELDPRRAREVIAQIPPERIAEITRELVGRREYVTMGRFVGHLQRPAVAAAVGVMDERALLQVGFVLENRDSFRNVLDLLSSERLERVIDTAAAEQLWPEALDLLTSLSDKQRRRVIEVAATRDDAVLDELIVSAHQQRMWELVLPLTGLMSQRSLERFAKLPSLQAVGVLEQIIDVAADDSELWNRLLPILGLLPETCQARVAARVGAIEAA